MTIDKQRLEDQVTAVTLSDLLLEGLIQFPNDETVLLTGQGVTRAMELWKAHSQNERTLLMLLIVAIDKLGEEGK